MTGASIFDKVATELEAAKAALAKALAETERARAEAEAEIVRLTGKLERQAAMLDKLAYVNEELERQQRELLASRWRKLGLSLRLAKRASFEG